MFDDEENEIIDMFVEMAVRIICIACAIGLAIICWLKWG